ncbi:unnamed protein product [Fusarium venenatum]|uniref:Uncharacterized protein n=1 Tax=Fusarium venenatum TaxID=56646 RepID=A0A2L2STP1_9HYPO|nr:uncharacterized protein FVRRES_05128 [Fusarium venenatum]CEI60692.1 unnamed protein product [Fusarium venenatum]
MTKQSFNSPQEQGDEKGEYGGGGKLEQGSGGLWLTASCKDSQRGVACFSGCYDDGPGRGESN